MSMSKHHRPHQEEFWINTTQMVTSPGHPFYQRLNRLLDEHGFDRFVESRCKEFYSEAMGRPASRPGCTFACC